MKRTLPLMFGSLRTLLGMTGKELDTPKEKEFYMNALPSAGTSIGSNLDNIEELSNRFGNSETALMVQSVRDLLNGEGEKDTRTPEDRLNRLRELRAKAGL